MRVIAGKYRSRLLYEISNEYTRPTKDKNREMVFNVLGQYFDGGVALDLFAGTGALGIEAISRGIDKCYFVDNNNLAHNVIKENLKSLKIDLSTLYKMDYRSFLSSYSHLKFDLVFLDPPYNLNVCYEILNELVKNEQINDGALIVIEVDVNLEKQSVDERLELLKEKEVRNTRFEFYEFRG